MRRKCETCGKFFSSENNKKFCSEECKATARRRKRKCIEGACLICNSEIDRASRAGIIYCSKKCREEGTKLRRTCKGQAELMISELEVTKDEGVAYIVAKRGEKITVDASLAGWLSQWNWTIGENGYPRNRTLTMHYLLKTLWGWSDMICDHKDRNKLNNTKDNLRPCTISQNASNKSPINKASGFKGVHRSASGKWQAMIWIEGKNRCLGTFDTCTEAAMMYNMAARALKGEFAYVNDI
jgi:hypothetical protein